MKKLILIAVALVVAIATPAYATGNHGQNKVTLCHATSSQSNPYVEITVAVPSVQFNGHDGHDDDIIPPFTGYSGKNWDAQHIAIFNNDCEKPAPPTTTTTTEPPCPPTTTTTTIAPTTTTTIVIPPETTTTTTLPTTTTTVPPSTTTTTVVPSTTTTVVQTTTTLTPSTTLTTVLPTTTTVSPTTTTIVTTQLANTGDSTELWMLGGAGLVLLGVGLVSLARRLREN